ncbi:MAG: hypothetical protein J6C23_05630 [Clostridia bacterium]|nr:hypothetical protein [Clostridia bacterium]
MNNKITVDKIVNVDIEYNYIIPSLDFRFETVADGFEKFYNLEIVNKAIGKYVESQISSDAFVYWCWSYEDIISADLNHENVFSLKDIVKLKICKVFTSLSTCRKINLTRFKADLHNIDSLYKTINEWSVAYAPYEMRSDAEDGEYIFLAVNHNKKLFSILYTCDLVYKGEERIYKERELNSLKRDLINRGYERIRCYS